MQILSIERISDMTIWVKWRPFLRHRIKAVLVVVQESLHPILIGSGLPTSMENSYRNIYFYSQRTERFLSRGPEISSLHMSSYYCGRQWSE